MGDSWAAASNTSPWGMAESNNSGFDSNAQSAFSQPSGGSAWGSFDSGGAWGLQNDGGMGMSDMGGASSVWGKCPSLGCANKRISACPQAAVPVRRSGAML